MTQKLLFCIIFPFFFLQSSIAQKKAIYTMFLQEAIPANGVSVDFNAPILRWPYQKGKQITYDVQLSQQEDFPAASTIIATALKGAIFNPHQKLATGRWFWRYRVSGKTWSPSRYFEVSEKSLPMVSPLSEEFLAKIPDEHPRILLQRPTDNITNLSKTADAAIIISDADKVLTEKLLTEADARPAGKGINEKQDNKIIADAVVALGNRVNHMLQPLCEAYLLTHNEKYVPKAIEIGMELSRWDPEGVSGSRDFTDGICMYDMALVFDTFYDRLDPQQRSTLQKAIKHRADKFYKSWVNNIESKVLSGHVWQLLLNEFFKTGLALHQHEPAADDWLAYAYELFLARSPVLGGIDGGWAEGASYFQMNMEMLIDIPEKIKLYTGFDFIQKHPWYKNNADWMIYQFPPGSSADGYGDNTEELFEPPASYAAYADLMARFTNSHAYSWYAKKLKQTQKIDLAHEPRMRWCLLLHTNDFEEPVGNDSLSFSMGRIFKEVGVASLHSNAAEARNDVMIAMRSSPFGAYGHILADQNTFNILYGGKRVFYRTGYKVAMDDPHRLGWSKHTKSQNGVLINEQGQPYSAESFGNFSRFMQGEKLAYIKGDASNAYQSVETKEDYGVSKFYRHVVLLKPNIIVIYDELESVADANWSWLIHSLENMKLDSVHNIFTSTIQNAKAVGKLWSSYRFSWQLSDKFDVPAIIFRNYKGMKTKKYDDTQWHLKAINRNKTSKIRFLSVIQISADGKIFPFKESSEIKGLTKLTISGWKIEAAMSYDLSPKLQIHSLDGNTAFDACGSDIKLKDQLYKSTITESSKLIEWINGKINFSETGDEPVRPLR